MAAAPGRSKAELADALRSWFLGRRPAARDLEVSVDRPQPGLSSDTLFVAVASDEGTEQFVVRLPPVGELSFPDYSLERQAAVQNALLGAGVPVAGQVTVEADAEVLGAPFVLMPRIDGLTLTTYPPYVREGWLAESSPEVQRTALESVLDGMAAVHRANVDVDITGGGPDLTGMLDYWERYLDWCGADPEATAVYRAALRWCRDNLPAEVPEPVLLWGDPQPTNVVFDETGAVVAMLDWEMTGRGPGEVDLSWFLVLQELGNDAAGTTLPGQPDRPALIARYAAAVGRPVHDLTWYDMFASLRSGAIVVRLGELMAAAGQSRSWTQHIPQRHHLEHMLESRA